MIDENTAQLDERTDAAHSTPPSVQTAPPGGSEVIRVMSGAMSADPRTRGWDRERWLQGMLEYADALDATRDDARPDRTDELREHVRAIDRITRDYGHLRATRAGDQLLEDVGVHVRHLLALLGPGT